ncbi:MAG TPA: phytoene/squalene synthase family protein [Aurantimonas sp.]|uniref:Squalene/phytoene synthase family protein n=1 Tax=Aurantimonas marianensis TaxID=2920428 RepID=A0A9X2KI72_9HYPH|nr:phytoene/squalene synthase family protein [Aurantimonas marianensis]MCP3055302.1 squalene/phytoene synthase family protein [Aurantimonas marianensis]
MSESTDECIRLVEAEDRDRAISLAFAPADKRSGLAALYAFDVEIARIRDKVSQPMPGEIRLQWWRDVLSGDGEGAAAHPVAAALSETIERHQLPRSAFDRLLDARIFDLYDDPMPSREAFEAYAGETASTLIMLAAMILSRGEADRFSDAAGHAGVATMVAGVLRSLPVHRARGQVYLPADLLAAAGCTAGDLVAGEDEPSSRALAAMVAFGRDHDRAWRQDLADMPRAVRPAFLPAALAASYLDRIEQAGLAALDTPVGIGPLRKTFLCWRTMRI